MTCISWEKEPKTKKRAAFLSWKDRNSGRLRRAVVNKSSKDEKEFRKLAYLFVCEFYGGMAYFDREFRPENAFFHCPVAMECFFYRRLSLKHFKGNNRENGVRDGVLDSLIPDISTPDIDNMEKFIMDSLQGLVYKDDKQVVSMRSQKWLDTKPPFTGRVVVRVKPMLVGQPRYVFKFPPGFAEECIALQEGRLVPPPLNDRPFPFFSLSRREEVNERVI